ncbi:ClpXP protease specificity-enhancing factor [Gammaproteobacteria bacterium]|nr:ClpXP protease specificity-enhancing factor [Gammaproteobacteria bacterium]
MHSNRPYLLKAFFDWIVDNQCTPYVIVDANYIGVEVPQEFVSDGQIVLNIAPRAVTNFEMNNEAVYFSTRFGGMPVDLYLPLFSITGIYAQENGKGMMFEPDETEEPPPPLKSSKSNQQSNIDDQKASAKPKPALRVVK